MLGSHKLYEFKILLYWRAFLKRLGMIGGFSPESTIDYYKRIISKYKIYKPNEYPEIIINSMDINKLFSYINENKLNELTNWLLEGIKDLQKAQVDIGFISANTPHIVFDKLQENTTLKLISIVESVCRYSESKNYRKLGLLGTKYTMNGSFFSDVFEKAGIKLIIPNPNEIEYIQQKYLEEIEIGNYKEDTRKKFLEIINNMIRNNKIEGIILGCTEFPIFLDGIDVNIELINTIDIHIEDIVNECINK
jgi:aspartate racemase